MKKLRLKNRDGILYFGIGDKFKSSKLKYTNVNKNIIIGKFKNGELNEALGLQNTSKTVPFILELLDEVLHSKSKVLKHKSMLAYSFVSKSNILPYFQDRLVSNIKPIDIKRWQDKLVEKGLKKQTINTARVLLKEVFELAVISEYMTINPIKMVSMPKIKYTKPKQKPFTLDEIDLILSSSTNQLRNFLGISFFTGMRSGELLALKWEDVDFITETISINKTIAAGIINSPKSDSSERDIEMLDQVKEFFKNQKLESGLKNTYVFLARTGSHFVNNSSYYKAFQKLLVELKLEKRALHNTRHTFASMMLNNSIDPLWVSHTLGHENLQITLNTYTHYMPKKEKMSIGFLEKRYKNGTKTS